MEVAARMMDAETKEDLRGTLAHTSMVDLLQFLNSTNRTGELELRSEDQGDKAAVYFSDGRISHACLGSREGLDALTELVGWDSGSFRFSPNVVCHATSVELSFQAAAMEAIRRHDERDAADSPQLAGRIQQELRLFLTTNDFATHAFMIDATGVVEVSGADLSEAPSWIERLRELVVQVVADYPRPHLNRLIFDDDQGTVIVSCLPDSSVLVVAAKRSATLGAVSIGVDRLVRTLRNLKKLGINS